MRKCVYCTAEEGEKSFKWRLNDYCDSCARMRARSRCDRCDGPMAKGRCGECDPPPKNKVPIILIDPLDNERLVYRRISSRSSHGVKFSFLGRPIIKKEPVVIAVSRKEFLKILC